MENILICFVKNNFNDIYINSLVNYKIVLKILHFNKRINVVTKMY